MLHGFSGVITQSEHSQASILRAEQQKKGTPPFAWIATVDRLVIIEWKFSLRAKRTGAPTENQLEPTVGVS